MQNKIKSGQTYLGIELGSTRIKACLTDDNYVTAASGSYKWENKFENGYWVYSLDDIHKGIRECFKNLSENVYAKYNTRLTTVGAIGVSAMMHGYMAFDSAGNLLVPFRTWRNTTTKPAADKLTELFGFNIPQRWSIAHLYQAILNGETHVHNIARITTLAGYIHYLLTGKHEVGIGDASGMFPICENDYDNEMIKKFDNISTLKKSVYDMLPTVKSAGAKGAFLTENGAEFLDPTHTLKPVIPLCPPEGDAGTGMIATNSIKAGTGNVSAGTSIFAMLVLQRPLKNLYREIDIVSTPDGLPVAMIHCNNCCGEIDAWINLFGEFADLIGADIDKSSLYDMLYKTTASANADCGGITAYNYISGEHVTQLERGAPMYFRNPRSKLTLSNFMLAQLYSAMATLKIGSDILFKNENVETESICAHGGLFKVKGIAQQILANAFHTNVSVIDTAAEGGAWGMALLAAYMMQGNDMTLPCWLSDSVFASIKTETLQPEKEGAEGFEKFMSQYKAGLIIQKELNI